MTQVGRLLCQKQGPPYTAWSIASQIIKFMGPTWGPPGSCRPQMDPMLVPWTLLSGMTADGMVKQGARASVAVVLTLFSCNIQHRTRWCGVGTHFTKSIWAHNRIMKNLLSVIMILMNQSSHKYSHESCAKLWSDQIAIFQVRATCISTIFEIWAPGTFMTPLPDGSGMETHQLGKITACLHGRNNVYFLQSWCNCLHGFVCCT